jgi:hypothetical protein
MFSFEAFPQKGVYSSIDLKFMPVNNSIGVIGGVQAGYRTAEGLEIGLGIYDLLNTFPAAGSTRTPYDSDANTKLHYGGITFSYAGNAGGNWKFTPKLLIGVGDVSKYRDKKANDYDWSWYWIIEPSIGIEYLLSEKWALGTGLGCTIPLNQDTVKYNVSLTRLIYGITAKYNF